MSALGAVRHLSHRRKEMNLVLWGYFDESGKFADSDFVCLCGYVCRDWDPFCLAWRDQLSRHGFSSLHMSKIRWKDARQVAALNDFAGIIRDHVILAFGVAVDAAYFRQMPIHKRKLLGDKDPRDFTFHQLLRLVRDDLEYLKMEDFLSLTFDYEDGFSKQCLDSLLVLRKTHESIRELVKQIGFADDEVFYQLQAADMFAYGYKKHLQGEELAYWTLLAQPVDVGFPGPRCMVANYDPPELEKVCEEARAKRVALEARQP